MAGPEPEASGVASEEVMGAVETGKQNEGREGSQDYLGVEG